MNNVISGYRTMLGYTQQDMADLLEISRQSYYMKEKGKTPFTDQEKIIIKKEVSNLFPDITIDEIFFSKSWEKFPKKEVK